MDGQDKFDRNLNLKEIGKRMDRTVTEAAYCENPSVALGMLIISAIKALIIDETLPMLLNEINEHEKKYHKE